MPSITESDVLVVGCGMAGLSAVNRATELGLDVTVLEKSPKEDRGGHTRYSESFRVASTEADIEQYGRMIDTTREMGDVPEPMAETVRHILFGATSNAERAALVECWVDRWLTYPGEAVYQEVSSWLERPDFTDELADIDVPALAIHGEEDTALEMEKARDMVDHLPDARLEPIPEAGHSSNLENPDSANAAIREFLADVY